MKTVSYTEGYRSGHNEAVLKTVWEQSHKGSNPFPSAKAPIFGVFLDPQKAESTTSERLIRLYYFYRVLIKAELVKTANASTNVTVEKHIGEDAGINLYADHLNVLKQLNCTPIR